MVLNGALILVHLLKTRKMVETARMAEEVAKESGTGSSATTGCYNFFAVRLSSSAVSSGPVIPEFRRIPSFVGA
jgi:hypothetical protein